MHKNSKIDKIGVEIEGGWLNGHKAIESVYGDGSVNIADYYSKDEDDSCEDDICGEVCSDPLPSLRNLGKWVREFYPDTTNETCGLHIHLSTKRHLDYALLMHKKFFDLFVNGMSEWGKKNLGNRSEEDKAFWKRLSGVNTYCRKEWKPIKQLQGDWERYTMLNYAAFRDHRTIECRLLPAFKDVEKSLRGIGFFVKLTDSYLKTMKPNDFTKKYLQEIESVL